MLSRSMLQAGNARGTREAARSAMEPTTPGTYSASGAILRVIPVGGEALSAYAERACSARLSAGDFGMLQQTQRVLGRFCAKPPVEQASKQSSKVGCGNTADTIFLKMVLLRCITWYQIPELPPMWPQTPSMILDVVWYHGYHRSLSNRHLHACTETQSKKVPRRRAMQ